MQVSRLLFSTLAAAGIVGLAGLAVAQTTPGTNNSTDQRANTTDTQRPAISASETTAERMERERMERERATIDRVNARNASDDLNARSTVNAARRDADGNLIARADRN